MNMNIRVGSFKKKELLYYTGVMFDKGELEQKFKVVFQDEELERIDRAICIDSTCRYYPGELSFTTDGRILRSRGAIRMTTTITFNVLIEGVYKVFDVLLEDVKSVIIPDNYNQHEVIGNLKLAAKAVTVENPELRHITNSGVKTLYAAFLDELRNTLQGTTFIADCVLKAERSTTDEEFADKENVSDHYYQKLVITESLFNRISNLIATAYWQFADGPLTNKDLVHLGEFNPSVVRKSYIIGEMTDDEGVEVIKIPYPFAFNSGRSIQYCSREANIIGAIEIIKGNAVFYFLSVCGSLDFLQMVREIYKPSIIMREGKPTLIEPTLKEE